LLWQHFNYRLHTQHDPMESFSLSEEGEAFFETIFSEKMGAYNSEGKGGQMRL